MNGSHNISPNFVALLQAIQVCAKTISDMNLSDAHDGTLPVALATAGDRMSYYLAKVQDEMFHSIAHPVPSTVFDRFVDHCNEV